MEEITQNVYDYIKSFTEEKGFPPTIHQTAEALNIKQHEVQEAYDQMEKSGKIKVTRIPSKTEITFTD